MGRWVVECDHQRQRRGETAGSLCGLISRTIAGSIPVPATGLAFASPDSNGGPQIRFWSAGFFRALIGIVALSYIL